MRSERYVRTRTEAVGPCKTACTALRVPEERGLLEKAAVVAQGDPGEGIGRVGLVAELGVEHLEAPTRALRDPAPRLQAVEGAQQTTAVADGCVVGSRSRSPPIVAQRGAGVEMESRTLIPCLFAESTTRSTAAQV